MQEAALHDACGNFRAETTGQWCFMHHHAAARLLHALFNRINVERINRAQVNQFNVLATLLDRLHALHNACAPTDDGELVSFAHRARLTDWQDILILWDFLAECSINALWLKEHHWIWIADGCNQQTLGVVRRTWHHYL